MVLRLASVGVWPPATAGAPRKNAISSPSRQTSVSSVSLIQEEGKGGAEAPAKKAAANHKGLPSKGLPPCGDTGTKGRCTAQCRLKLNQAE